MWCRWREENDKWSRNVVWEEEDVDCITINTTKCAEVPHLNEIYVKEVGESIRTATVTPAEFWERLAKRLGIGEEEPKRRPPPQKTPQSEFRRYTIIGKKRRGARVFPALDEYTRKGLRRHKHKDNKILLRADKKPKKQDPRRVDWKIQRTRRRQFGRDKKYRLAYRPTAWRFPAKSRPRNKRPNDLLLEKRRKEAENNPNPRFTRSKWYTKAKSRQQQRFRRPVRY